MIICIPEIRPRVHARGLVPVVREQEPGTRQHHRQISKILLVDWRRSQRTDIAAFAQGHVAPAQVVVHPDPTGRTVSYTNVGTYIYILYMTVRVTAARNASERVFGKIKFVNNLSEIFVGQSVYGIPNSIIIFAPENSTPYRIVRRRSRNFFFIYNQTTRALLLLL